MTVHVHLRCPACGHTWHAATINHSAWWGKGVTPETVARQCHCVHCNHTPPMTVDGHVTQGDLFPSEATA